MKMIEFVYKIVLLSELVNVVSGLRVLKQPPLNCTRQGLRCEVNIDYCFEERSLAKKKWTPSGPRELRWDVTVTKDENGDIVPVITVRWKTQLDGSVRSLRGAEVHLLKMSTNMNLCVRYKFLDKINTAVELEPWWSFSLNGVVVDPGEAYYLSVSNLPKTNRGQNHNQITENITIKGSLWKPDINMTQMLSDGRKVVAVELNSGEYADKYRVFLNCRNFTHHQDIMKGNMTKLKVTFDCKKFPTSCCVFEVTVQAFFIRCDNACTRKYKNFNMCSTSPIPVVPPTAALTHGSTVVPSILGMLLVCMVAVTAYLFYRRQQKDRFEDLVSPQDPPSAQKAAKDSGKPETVPRKVLIIYSMDHPLYKDIVLKLCAFLRAKCGTEVVLDLLDSGQVSIMGRMWWLEWQKEQLEGSSGKILVLCSRGIQAKWRAMCGGPQVRLREDEHSPTGDTVTPAFSLIVPDLLQTAALGKYVVTYFEGVCGEEDVPSPFRITITYKLMSHFEDVYLRILDKEKMEPWRINHVEGVGKKEYYKCPSGRALRDAIEAFQAYQLQNPDWFERECMEGEEEPTYYDIQLPLLKEMYSSSIIHCLPECDKGPIHIHKMEVVKEESTISSTAPENHIEDRSSIHGFQSLVKKEQCKRCSLIAQDTSISHIYSSVFRQQLYQRTDPEVQQPISPLEITFCQQEAPKGDRHAMEKKEERLSLPHMTSSHPAEQLHAVVRQPVHTMGTFHRDEEEAEEELEEYPLSFLLGEQQGKRPWSGSDQGYFSRTSIPSVALSRGDSQSPQRAPSRAGEG